MREDKRFLKIQTTFESQMSCYKYFSTKFFENYFKFDFFCCFMQKKKCYFNKNIIYDTKFPVFFWHYYHHIHLSNNIATENPIFPCACWYIELLKHKRSALRTYTNQNTLLETGFKFLFFTSLQLYTYIKLRVRGRKYRKKSYITKVWELNVKHKLTHIFFFIDLKKWLCCETSDYSQSALNKKK